MKKDTKNHNRLPRARREKNSKKNATKIRPLPGLLEARYVTCGKPNCRCAKGQLHGPYFCRRWVVDGNRRSTYIRKQAISDVKVAISAFKHKRESSRKQRRRGDELLNLLRMIRREQRDRFNSMVNGGS